MATLFSYVVDHDLGFARKVDLLRALNLIPEHLLSFASAIGKIRNKFAHSLSLDSLDDMDMNAKNLIKSAYYAPPNNEKTKKPLGEMLREMVQITVIGIRSYESNIKLLAKIIRSEEFLDHLEQTYRKEFDLMLEKLRKLTSGRKGISAVTFDESGEPVLVPAPSKNVPDPDPETKKAG